MAEKKRIGRWSKSEMYPLIELYEESGLTQKQYCEEMEIKMHTFSYWLSKYRKTIQNGLPKSNESKFVSLDLSEEEQEQDSIVPRLMRISYPDGTLIELPV